MTRKEAKACPDCGATFYNLGGHRGGRRCLGKQAENRALAEGLELAKWSKQKLQKVGITPVYLYTGHPKITRSKGPTKQRWVTKEENRYTVLIDKGMVPELTVQKIKELDADARASAIAVLVHG